MLIHSAILSLLLIQSPIQLQSILAPITPQQEEEQKQIQELQQELKPIFEEAKKEAEEAIQISKKKHFTFVNLIFQDSGWTREKGFGFKFQIIIVLLDRYFTQQGYVVQIYTHEDQLRFLIDWTPKPKSGV